MYLNATFIVLFKEVTFMQRWKFSFNSPIIANLFLKNAKSRFPNFHMEIYRDPSIVVVNTSDSTFIDQNVLFSLRKLCKELEGQLL